MIIASARGPGLSRGDVIRQMVQDSGWKLVLSGGQSLLGYQSASRRRRTEDWFWTPCPREKRRGKACSVVSLHVHWQVRQFTIRRHAVLCSKTSGRRAVLATVSHHCRCSRCRAANAEGQRQFGSIGVPLPRSVGPVQIPRVRGGQKQRWRFATLGCCCRVPRRRIRAPCGAPG